jgi:hypothetical protein
MVTEQGRIGMGMGMGQCWIGLDRVEVSSVELS